MALQLIKDTALDISLPGTVGSFRIGSKQNGSKSLEVKYLLTHVALNFAGPSNDKLLSALAPVREIFDFKQLDFSEIMQRDIDDARVSSELVPYLLDEQSNDMIKLFPPIVIVVMPTKEGRALPDNLYPEVKVEKCDANSEHQGPWVRTRSGPVGQEVFQFEQLLLDNHPVEHDLVRLRLNSHRARLVIVDGQHRAMALLAIYRNLKDQWSDERRAPFREYYSIWTPNFINNFNLEEIKLPVMLCTVPELDSKYVGNFDMKQAARSIFLTLNKTARQVSDSRNKLLDDNDLISNFMRRTLSNIKQKDERSPYAMHIVNVELDQDGSKQKVLAPVAITGVPHLYYMIEHMMLDNGSSVEGVRPRSGAFFGRTKLHDLLDRLDGRNILGQTTADEIRRDTFTPAAAEELGKQFDKQYGACIIQAFEKFSPFDKHNRAVIDIGNQLELEHDRQLKPILFEGQGIGRVFEAHRQNLTLRLRNKYFKTDVPLIEGVADRLNATATRISETVSRLQQLRAERLFDELSDKKALQGEDSALLPSAIDWCNRLYGEIFTSVAFQTALICGFLGLVEKAERNLKNGDHPGEPAIDHDLAFEEYISQLNKFFVPKTPAQLRRLVRVFSGETAEDGGIWPLRPSNQTFRGIVYRGEMQPDQWPKYRYLLMEIWEPTHVALKAVVSKELSTCRAEVFSALYGHYKASYCRENQKLDEELTKEETTKIFNQAFDAYNGLLKSVGTDLLGRRAMQAAISNVPASAATESEPTSDDGEDVSAI